MEDNLSITLNHKQSYVAAFLFLCKYYERTKLNDLGGMLGCMSPYLWSGGMPIDITMYDDWVEIFNNKHSSNEEVSFVECLEIMITYVEFKIEEMHLNFESLPQFLKDLLSGKEQYNNIWTEWINCCSSAKLKEPNN